MSKPLKHDNDLLAQVDKHSRSRARWPQGHSLCNQPPAAPTGVSITWDRIDQTRHSPTRGIVTWDEVTLDVDGFTVNPKDIARYVINFQKSEDGSTADARTRKFVVEAKDADSDTTGEKVIRAGIHMKRWYRARVRAVDKDSRRGTWSAWTSWQHPNPANNAAAPGTVTKIETDRRVGIDWIPAGTFTSTDNSPDGSVSHYEVQVSKSNTFGTLVAHQRHHVSDHYRFAVPAVDDGVTHYLRVRSVSADGDVSAWQPASTGIAANSIAPGVSGLPAGTIIHHATASPTTWAAAHGFLYCDGASYATATYVDLFAEIGYTYGGSGANFNVPDSKGRHLIGVSSVFALGANDGDAEGSRGVLHTHASDSTSATTADNNVFTTPGSDSTSTTPNSDSTGEAGHTHAFGGADTSNANNGSSATVGGGNAAGAGHDHNLAGFTSQSGASHGHGHTHSGHGHGHTHGDHGHNHGHGNHPHPHTHDQKKRPHLAQHVFIKT